MGAPKGIVPDPEKDTLDDLPGEDTRHKYDQALAQMYESLGNYLGHTPIDNSNIPLEALRGAHKRFERCLAVAIKEQEAAQ
jgi:hypothetical protein